jgi:probable F420-dependent oxidoreductase
MLRREGSLKFICSLAFAPPDQLLPLARAADAAGFDAVSVSDHVVHPHRIATPYPYSADGAPRWQPFTSWPDPWVAIGAMAAVTTRLRFLTSVFVLPLRNPFLVAKAVSTAAVLSGGRVTLGVGAGWMREEFALLEQSFEQRGRRMDEMIDLLRALWAGGWVERRGEFYAFDALEMTPVPKEEVPIWVGGLSEPALRRAATRGDGWISDLHTTEELRGIAARLHSLRADSERAGRPFAVAAAVKDAFTREGYQRAADAGVTHIQTMPWLFYPGASDSLQAKCDALRRFGDEIGDGLK